MVRAKSGAYLLAWIFIFQCSNRLSSCTYRFDNNSAFCKYYRI